MNCINVNYLHLLPEDLLDLLVSFADIPSIGALCQTSRPTQGSISHVASREKVWLRIASLRFNLFSMKTNDQLHHHKYLSYSRLYGGPTWKEAYRSMSLTCRMPKMGANFKKKHIFAKGRLSTRVIGDGENSEFSSKSSLQEVKKHNMNFLAAWLMINHTEDCRLRYFSNVRQQELRPFNSEYEFIQQDNTGVVYIQLQLAIQNTKSACCTVHVNVGSATIQMYTSTGSIMTQGIIQSGVLGPQVIYRKHNRNILTSTTTSQSLDRKRSKGRFLDEKCQNIVSLKPFEFVVMSINVPLSLPHPLHHTERLHFETDFLSRAISICIPATCEVTNQPQTGTGLQLSFNKRQTSDVHCTHLIARFISENEIWDRYMELPGNCLVLVDRRD